MGIPNDTWVLCLDLLHLNRPLHHSIKEFVQFRLPLLRAQGLDLFNQGSKLLLLIDWRTGIRLSCDGQLLIQILLETGKERPDFFRPAQIGHGIGDGVMILEPQ